MKTFGLGPGVACDLNVLLNTRLTQLLVTHGGPETIDGDATEAAEGVPA